YLPVARHRGSLGQRYRRVNPGSRGGLAALNERERGVDLSHRCQLTAIGTTHFPGQVDMTHNAGPHSTPPSHRTPDASPVLSALPGLPVLRDVRDADQEFLLDLYRFTHGSMHEV